MPVLAENRRARHDYEILETHEAGIALRGTEVKSLMTRRGTLHGAYAVIRGSEAWLLNMDIPPYQPKNVPPDYDGKRTRKLLLHASELRKLIGRTSEKGLTLVPVSLYTRNGKIKVLLGLGKAKNKRDKREVLKKKEAEREMGRRR